MWLRVPFRRAEPRTRVLNVFHREASGARAQEGTLTCSCLRASSCSCLSFAILCALSASAFRRSSCSFSFARFSKFALMLLVLLFTTEGRRDARRASERQRVPRPQPRTRAACHAGPGVTGRSELRPAQPARPRPASAPPSPGRSWGLPEGASLASGVFPNPNGAGSLAAHTQEGTKTSSLRTGPDDPAQSTAILQISSPERTSLAGEGLQTTSCQGLGQNHSCAELTDPSQSIVFPGRNGRGTGVCLVHLAGFLPKINQLSLSLVNGKTQASEKNSELWKPCIYSEHDAPQVHVKTLVR